MNQIEELATIEAADHLRVYAARRRADGGKTRADQIDELASKLERVTEWLTDDELPPGDRVSHALEIINTEREKGR